MLQITSIKNGLVIDHIEAGMGIKIFHYLNLEGSGAQVALIMNVCSNNMGKKDIIKIEDCYDIDYTSLALLSPGITINEIREQKIISKIKPVLPEKVYNIIKCKNSRCITSVEKYVPQSFIMMDSKKGTYRCEYCDHITSLKER
ncbi:MAG: aspartate carbamoyltransferase regulatory subunit [Clostridium sp.]